MHSESPSAVMLLLLTDWNECIQSGGANSVTVAPWHMKSQPQMLVTSKAAFLEKYLAVSTCIFNGSSIECHREEASTFQFIWCSIWKLGNSNFLGENELSTHALTPSYNV